MAAISPLYLAYVSPLLRAKRRPEVSLEGASNPFFYTSAFHIFTHSGPDVLHYIHYPCIITYPDDGMVERKGSERRGLGILVKARGEDVQPRGR